MAKPSTTHVIEIESGIGEPAFIPLTLGQELQPISVGKKGMWRIESARVLDVHAFVYFDGSALFLQSADESASAAVDGLAVGKAWTELHAPCTIEVGAARLRYRSLLAGAQAPDRTSRAARGPAPQSGEAALSELAAERVDDDAPTRSEGSGGAKLLNRTGAMPIATDQPEPPHMRTQHLAPPPPTMSMPPPPPVAVTGPPPPMVTTVQPGAPAIVPRTGPGISGPYHYSGMPPPHPSMPLGQSGSQQSVTDGSLSDGTSGGSVLQYVARYKELSLPKQILIILAPFCLLASAYLIAFDPTTRPGPQASFDGGYFDAGYVAATQPTAPPAPIVIAPPPTVQVVCPPGFVPYPMPVAPGTAVPCVPAGTPVPAPPATVATVDAGPAPGGKTLERQAVDAVAGNDYARAAAFYEQLQQQNPQNRVYAEAARILREKADGGP